MITDLLRNKKYREAKLVTLIKDFGIFSGILVVTMGLVVLFWGFIVWENPVNIFLLHQDRIFGIIRFGLGFVLVMAIYFNNASHKIELEKIARPKQ